MAGPQSWSRLAGGNPVRVDTSPYTQHGCPMIVLAFIKPTCGPCPVRELCTTSRRGFRQLTLNPRPLTEALRTARAEQTGRDSQDTYALRSGVEGTIRQALAVTDSRRARYRRGPGAGHSQAAGRPSSPACWNAGAASTRPSTRAD
ncbi:MULTISPECIES: transposase [unclassified Streptomyces]|uniref:transposase n=1 Tax=unclassified Streptomyces TaxID=2593676 RepID=UPI000DAD29EC|nr:MULTISPECIES: transposase [unclassified Streptomyces]PZT73781.1 hypothetical protein DNK55_16300 [Streptomyces sp. AC1-42T]PZT83223.1 hypothetical protein DNK56_15125 [Streptomyces sp. AC1-42W]